MNSAQIKSSVAEALKQSAPTDFSSRPSLIRSLQFMYHTIKASEDLLSLSMDRSEGALRTYLKRHLQEEDGHDRWLKNDLREAGADVGRPSDTVLAMVGSLYYLIRNVDACALLGYMVVLECFPLTLEQVDALESAHGHSLLRTVRYHAEHDVDHGAEVLQMIDTLSDAQRALVHEAAVLTARYLALASHTF